MTNVTLNNVTIGQHLFNLLLSTINGISAITINEASMECFIKLQNSEIGVVSNIEANLIQNLSYFIFGKMSSLDELYSMSITNLNIMYDFICAITMDITSIEGIMLDNVTIGGYFLNFGESVGNETNTTMLISNSTNATTNSNDTTETTTTTTIAIKNISLTNVKPVFQLVISWTVCMIV